MTVSKIGLQNLDLQIIQFNSKIKLPEDSTH